MSFNADQHLDRLTAWLSEFDSALVAYSGGVDSSLVMAAAYAQLGDRALACIGVSPSYPSREMREAVRQAELLGVPYRKVRTEEYLDGRYLTNDASRCFFCKSDLYGRLHEIAVREGWAVVLDGSNASDLGDDRPGMKAAEQHAVRSPLIELGINKQTVRAMAERLGVPTFDKPAMACLSSRVPRGTAITPKLLQQIESAEDVLYDLGLRQFRVRHHGEIARIELPRELFDAAMEHHDTIVEGVQAAGYKYACLDLAGFRRDEAPQAVTSAVALTIEGQP